MNKKEIREKIIGGAYIEVQFLKIQMNSFNKWILNRVQNDANAVKYTGNGILCDSIISPNPVNPVNRVRKNNLNRKHSF